MFMNKIQLCLTIGHLMPMNMVSTLSYLRKIYVFFINVGQLISLSYLRTIDVHEVPEWGDNVSQGRMRRSLIDCVEMSALAGGEDKVRWHLSALVVHLEMD